MIAFTKTIRSENHAIAAFLHEFKIGYLKWLRIADAIKGLDKADHSSRVVWSSTAYGGGSYQTILSD